ncbi:MAG TPA: hypothetical protein VE595_05740 [Nitrososphaeraceae archaeon]|nr:hypothetical protein [Nitrososphaeraceae archaeon]
MIIIEMENIVKDIQLLTIIEESEKDEEDVVVIIGIYSTITLAGYVLISNFTITNSCNSGPA